VTGLFVLQQYASWVHASETTMGVERFLTRDNTAYNRMLSALYAIATASVRPSHEWLSQKRLKFRSVKFSPYTTVAPSQFVFGGEGYVSFKNSNGSPSGGVKQLRGGENKPFSSFKALNVNISETVCDTSKITTND